MDLGRQRPSVKEVREIDLVDYLSRIGYEPEKISGVDYWYLSPLRIENTASFKVNRKLNRWYDHGIGKGGNLIDFGILYYGCSVADLLDRVASNFSFHKPSNRLPSQLSIEPKLTIIGNYPVSSISLLRYLEQRAIPAALADQFCRELRYDVNGKKCYGIGFKNDSGGYEIRNPYFKASSSPKDITTFSNGTNEVAVFEGFIDFLSFLVIYKMRGDYDTDFTVLNSISFFERARPFMEVHSTIKLFFDRDTAGKNVSRYALLLSEKYRDESSLYADYKDLNDWLIKTSSHINNKHLGKSP